MYMVIAVGFSYFPSSTKSSVAYWHKKAGTPLTLGNTSAFSQTSSLVHSG